MATIAETIAAVEALDTPKAAATGAPSIMKPKAAVTQPSNAAAPKASTPATPTPAPKAAPGPITTKAAINDTRLREFNATVAKLGEADGKGSGARKGMAFAAMQAAHDGVITPEDTKSVYVRYKKAAAKAANGDYSEASDKTIKQQLSKLKQIIRMGAIKAFDPVPVMEKSMDVVRMLADAGTISASRNDYEDMVDAARCQMADPSKPVTEEQITEHFMPTEREVSLLKEIKKLTDKAAKLYEGTEDLEACKDERLGSAIDALSDLLRDLEKKDKVMKFMAAAAAAGLNITVA